MTCVKTGFYAYLEPHGMWLYGDAHQDRYEEVYIFRICQKEHTPIGPKKHYTINNFDYWFDEEHTSQKRNSTMLCAVIDVIDHGYEGISV